MSAYTLDEYLLGVKQAETALMVKIIQENPNLLTALKYTNRKNKDGLKETIIREGTLPSVENRGLNDSDPTYDFGKDYEVDEYVTAFRSGVKIDKIINRKAQRERQLNKLGKAIKHKLQDQILWGDRTSDIKQLDGLYARVKGTKQEIDIAGNNGTGTLAPLQLSTSTNRLAFIKYLDLLLNKVRKSSVNDIKLVMGLSTYSTLKNVFMLEQDYQFQVILSKGEATEMQNTITAINNIPIMVLDYQPDETEYLAMTETVGGISTCGSIWLINFSEDMGITGIKDEEFLRVEHLAKNDSNERYLIDFPFGLSQASDYSIARMTGFYN